MCENGREVLTPPYCTWHYWPTQSVNASSIAASTAMVTCEETKSLETLTPPIPHLSLSSWHHKHVYWHRQRMSKMTTYLSYKIKARPREKHVNLLTHFLVILPYITAMQGVWILLNSCQDESNFTTLTTPDILQYSPAAWLSWLCGPLGTDGASRGGERQSHRGFSLRVRPEQCVSNISKRNKHAQCGR